MPSINVKALDKGDAEDVCWFIAESLASMNDTAGTLVNIAAFLRSAYKLTDEEEDIIQNPSFLANGHGGRSPSTRKYFSSRGLKNFGGGAASFASGLASGVTMVDTVGIVQGANAVGTTTAHLVGVKAAGARFKKSQTITRWVDAIIAAKSAKLGVRAAGLAGSAIPIPAVGLGIGIATTVAKLGIKVTMQNLITRTSMEVHWRAYQELAISRGLSGGTGAAGPASAMFYEIFTKRGITRIFGKYDAEALIKEPGGWMALRDKLMLI